MKTATNIVRPTELVPMSPAIDGDESLVFFKGYMSERYTETADSNLWVRQIRAAGWRGAIWQLQWDSGRSGEILRKIGFTMLVRLGMKLVKRRLLLPLPPIGVYELNEIRRHWATVSQRADVVDASAILDLVRHEMKSGKVTLLGHSLGAKIVFNMLCRGRRDGFVFKDAIFMGGALPRRSEVWIDAVDSVERTLLNVHHKGDWVLRYLYRFGEMTRFSPCGLKPIGLEHEKIRNVEVSEWLPRSFSSHVRYPEVIEHTAGKELWRETASVIYLPATMPSMAEREEVATRPRGEGRVR